MTDGRQRLMHEWETSGMDTDGCYCCTGAAELHRRDMVQALRRKEIRLQRMAQFLVAGLLVLISVSVVLFVTVAYARKDSQPTTLPIIDPSDFNIEQQLLNDSKNPSAMLTAPKVKNTGEYLEWESNDGHALCLGGFNYSSGNLVVPRDGIYRVFLQITYESKIDLKCDKLRLSNRVIVFREIYTANVPILSSVDTVSCSMEPWSKSLYTAGLFFLEAKSILRVKSSHTELIAKREYQVFFGAELLPSF